MVSSDFRQFAQVTSNIIEAIVSTKRLSSFLTADELQVDARKVVTGLRLQKGDVVVTIKNGTFSWSKKSASPTLEDIDLTVRMGELVGIMGKVGAGKVSVRFPALNIALLIPENQSSLLSSVVGDMYREEGEVILNGSIAYAPQNPWQASLPEPAHSRTLTDLI